MTEQKFIEPPLAVHFVWHPNDRDNIFPIISKFRHYLTRDIDKPFSRELNIPTFLYSSRKQKTSPNNVPQKLAEHDVVFLFVSANTVTSEEWKKYINSIEGRIIPVALDKDGLNHSYDEILKNNNFIRAFDWLENREMHAILALSHELYRFGLNHHKSSEYKIGKDSSIKLFLSHAKKGDTGLKHAEAIKRFIDDSNMRRFFDANEISPSYKFDQEIENHINDSTVIAISSDAYSSRYWCQREILYAKRQRRPIIAVNSLSKYEDRVFPAAANVPCVHVTADPLTEESILNILIAALLETIRFEHAHKLLSYYQKQGWIDGEAEIFARPPEIQQVVDLLPQKKNASTELSKLHICYPEPPLYKEETDWTDILNIEVSTPLWSSKEDDAIHLKIGLSISDFESDGYERHHQDLDELKRFSQILTRHILAREGTLIYGGDLRDDGFTQFILDEATILRDRLQTTELHIKNYLAWPIYVEEKNRLWHAKYAGLVKKAEIEIPEDILNKIADPNIFLPPNCPENKYIWSRCLTKMRDESIKNSDARIFAGGKCQGYLGKMPGVLEEFMIALNKGKPIYLIGRLGGICKLISDAILNKMMPEELTEEWQITNNSGYKVLQGIAKDDGHQTNYSDIKHQLLNIDIEKLAKNAVLSKDDYVKLMTTPFLDECVHLILKGLKVLKGNLNAAK